MHSLMDIHSKSRVGISEFVMVRAATAALEDVTNRKFTKNMQKSIRTRICTGAEIIRDRYKDFSERGKGISIVWTCGLWRLWGNDDQTGCSGRRKGISEAFISVISVTHFSSGFSAVKLRFIKSSDLRASLSALAIPFGLRFGL